MSNYKKMYFQLFNSITDALNQLEKNNIDIATVLLKKAQINSEELYIKQEQYK